jgi:hypothetical protein
MSILELGLHGFLVIVELILLAINIKIFTEVVKNKVLRGKK